MNDNSVISVELVANIRAFAVEEPGKAQPGEAHGDVVDHERNRHERGPGEGLGLAFFDSGQEKALDLPFSTPG